MCFPTTNAGKGRPDGLPRDSGCWPVCHLNQDPPAWLTSARENTSRLS